MLAGGRASRFGSDKLRATLKGRPLLSRVLDAARELSTELALVVREPPPEEPPGVEIVFDPPEVAGPLAGLVSALAWTRRPRLLVLAGDLPLLDAAMLRRLVDFDPQAAAVAPEVGGKIHPLCAVYSADLLPTARALLASGARAAHRLFEEARGRAVPPAALGEEAAVLLALRGVNTPLDLDAAGGP